MALSASARLSTPQRTTREQEGRRWSLSRNSREAAWRGTTGAPLSELWPSEGCLELVYCVDRQRVDVASFGELERDEVAEHRRPEQAGDAGLASGLDLDRLGAGRGDRLGCQLEAAALARVLVGVFEQDGSEALARPGADL